MNGVISRTSPYGFQVQGSADWINLSKFDTTGLNDSFKAAKSGDIVSYEVKVGKNGKAYLTALTLNGGQQPAAPAQITPSVQVVPGKSQDAAAPRGPDDKDLRITRLSALSTAFGEPYRAFAALEGVSTSEATEMSEVLAERLVRYALTGKFNNVAEEALANAQK